MSEITTQSENSTEEVKEVIIGEFKPKRKFLNFVSAVNGAKVRFIRDIAFVKGGKLSGMLDDVIFKITICDEGTINFDEVETNMTDKAQRQRLINDIDDIDVTGYAQKFIVAGLEFADKDGGRCYLEVETKKPIDRLKSIFDDEEKAEVSDKGLSILDQLFGNSEESTVESEPVESVIEATVVEKVEDKSVALSYMEESFRKMNEAKILELKTRIEDTGKDIRKYKTDISNAESKLKECTQAIGVLETRLDSMTPIVETNGYSFYVSEEQKNETGLDETTRSIADKIADLMKLKKDVLFDYLTSGFYKIKIAKTDNLTDETLAVEKEIIESLLSIDHSGKISMTGIGEYEYRGDLNWHQLVGKMIRKGFEQNPAFDELCRSNSYESKEELKEEKKGCCSDSSCTDSSCKDESCACGENKTCQCETPTKEDKTQLIQEIDTPQDIVILGNSDISESFSITDDYSMFNVRVGTKDIHVESNGFVGVTTLEKFLDYYKKGETQDGEEIDLYSTGAVLLKNFSGEIRVGAVDEKGNQYDFDINDYIQPQIKANRVDIVVYLPIGTEAVEITDDNIKSLVRDGKISSVLNGGIKINKFSDMDNEEDEEAGNAELEELEEEFEEQTGYPLGEEFVFAIYEDDGEISIPITPKSYWDNENCQYDGHVQEIIENRFPSLKNIPDFGESCESTFESSLDMNGIIEELCKAGIKPCRGFQDFISQKDTQDVMNIVTQLGYQNLIC